MVGWDFARASEYDCEFSYISSTLFFLPRHVLVGYADKRMSITVDAVGFLFILTLLWQWIQWIQPHAYDHKYFPGWAACD